MEDALNHEIVLQGEVAVSGDSSVEVARMAQPKEDHFFILRWSFGETTGCNHYLSFHPPITFDWYIRCLKEAQLYSFEGFDIQEGYPCR